jgi:hypothetical protein
MKLVTHGGQCCGIKIIHTMGWSPSDDYECPPLKKARSHPAFPGAGYDYNNPGKRFFWDKAPAEHPLRRLDRYLAFCDRERPNGVVEIVLSYNEEDEEENQVPQWEPDLLTRGFKKVNECLNSNSGNYVCIYHRNSGEVPVITFEEESE